jgi:hypothetical protein
VVNANDPQQPVYDARLYWYCDGELYGGDSPEDLGTVLATATAFRAGPTGSIRLRPYCRSVVFRTGLGPANFGCEPDLICQWPAVCATL